MSKMVKSFNKLIEYKLGHLFGNILIDVQLKEHWNGNLYDLVFMFGSPYNNPMIQIESVLRTCDELFDWVDLTEMRREFRITIITQGDIVRYYKYFELMDELYKNNYIYRINNHPKYHRYREWRRNKECVERNKRLWELEMERIQRNENYKQMSIMESRKKKFLFW